MYGHFRVGDAKTFVRNPYDKAIDVHIVRYSECFMFVYVHVSSKLTVSYDNLF